MVGEEREEREEQTGRGDKRRTHLGSDGLYRMMAIHNAYAMGAQPIGAPVVVAGGGGGGGGESRSGVQCRCEGRGKQHSAER